MTFSQLINKVNKNNEQFIKYVCFELIKHHSKIIIDDIDILVNKNTSIDFAYDVFLIDLNKVLNENYPVEYITLKKYFYKNYHYVREGVLVPRQETEYIIDWVISNKLLENKKTILDLCSGSGVIANTLWLENRHINVIGIEKYKVPFDVCIKNKEILKTNVSFIFNDIFEIENNYYKNADFIICNPPYIDIDDKNIDISTKFEPNEALFASNNGYYFYFSFFDKYLNLLKSKTDVVFEIGFNQKEELERYLEKYKNIINFEFIKDLDNNYRILHIIKK